MKKDKFLSIKMYRVSTKQINVHPLANLEFKEKIEYIRRELSDSHFISRDEMGIDHEEVLISEFRNIIFYNPTENSNPFEGVINIMYYTKSGLLKTLNYQRFFIEEFREKLLNYIDRYRDEESISTVRKIILLLGEKDIFARNKKHHITASAWLVNKNLTHALLIKHKKLGIWVQPGGHCDGDTDISNVVLKEVREETGLQNLRLVSPIFDIDIHTIPEHGDVPEHEHFDIRFMVISDKEDVTINQESTDFRWISKTDDNREHHLGLKRMIDKWSK